MSIPEYPIFNTKKRLIRHTAMLLSQAQDYIPDSPPEEYCDKMQRLRNSTRLIVEMVQANTRWGYVCTQDQLLRALLDLPKTWQEWQQFVAELFEENRYNLLKNRPLQ